MSRVRYQISIRKHVGTQYTEQESFSVYPDDCADIPDSATEVARVLRDFALTEFDIREIPELYSDRKERREGERHTDAEAAEKKAAEKKAKK